ncbi:D-methionine transport system substrate-binding protein [Streptococcus gallolyticus]|uniref:Lipoprotein n=1 Tax=Streptococcus gallolyticus TaxID=315405 RepID=A0A1H9MU76_9STRE|nr:MetQ/NlpA family ABC transporter substrate-binding protein [Streptococcus gallolyticus]MCY7171445.1 MetQ/NlpA family ABC transporter substrate-binding protein [Streptococcus gallolyticus subsp. gallolyticus]SEF21666.1 D-methionine transport system substrate-binding protein [Streptococcus gallolyticus]SEM09267.1 D-methionine transport system substrate-binding protein [Streptococcus gallolyticus]SER27029.1 D-methionine transport system substrate-binding protein [Streptococcus gallolyticus]
MKLKKIFGLASVAFASTVLLAACGSSSSSSSSDDTTLKVGIMTLDDATEPLWDKVKELAEDKGVKIELVEFTDYNQPNEALQNGEIDVNAFQHKYFLSNWNSENDGTLVEVADTLLSPIRLFSGTDSDGDAKYTDVSDIPDKGTISIPNDASNESRALYLLQSAGLIELDVSGDELATIKNISSNPKNLDIKEVDAAQTASTLTSVDAAVINNSYAQSADVDYDTTLYKEAVDENSNQWINVIAAQKGWKKSDKADAIKTLVSVYQTDEVGKIIEEASDGADIPAWDGATVSSSSSDDD